MTPREKAIKHKSEVLKLTAMSLHDSIQINNEDAVIRVMGGWIYTTQNELGIATTFVPFTEQL